MWEFPRRRLKYPVVDQLIPYLKFGTRNLRRWSHVIKGNRPTIDGFLQRLILDAPSLSSTVVPLLIRKKLVTGVKDLIVDRKEFLVDDRIIETMCSAYDEAYSLESLLPSKIRDAELWSNLSRFWVQDT